MKKILLPTDFSDNSLNAIRYAVQLFKDQECEFILLNTFTPVVYRVEYMEVGVAQYGLLDAMRDTSKKGLREVQQKIEAEFNNPKHTFTRRAAFNILSSEIEELYEKKVMDIIVMGTQGASGIDQILFGSNTVHVIKSAKCPLLAIPNDYTFVTPNKILFPSDYEIDFQEKQLQTIKDIVELYNSELQFFHVSYTYQLTHKQDENRQKLANYFKDITSDFNTVYDKNIVDAIMECQSEKDINLLAMINNKQSFFENLFFGSNINKIGFRVDVPFLVIPAKE
ncbi:universal stress protein [uncultured Kordia sp.]|uniref:universal stress protein n=1 Tax=uncultured Kordia sp. TaxID=507699 RepID=UPI002606A44D|nr:universal stress protein [uncultured Kordia sp.]